MVQDKIIIYLRIMTLKGGCGPGIGPPGIAPPGPAVVAAGGIGVVLGLWKQLPHNNSSM